MFIDTFFNASRVSFQMAPNNFRYNFYLFAREFIEVFIVFQLCCGIILSLNRTQSYAYKQTRQVQQEEINYFKMNCQIESKGPKSQLILVMDNFHCACYCRSSVKPKGKEKNDF